MGPNQPIQMLWVGGWVEAAPRVVLSNDRHVCSDPQSLAPVPRMTGTSCAAGCAVHTGRRVATNGSARAIADNTAQWRARALCGRNLTDIGMGLPPVLVCALSAYGTMSRQVGGRAKIFTQYIEEEAEDVAVSEPCVCSPPGGSCIECEQRGLRAPACD